MRAGGTLTVLWVQHAPGVDGGSSTFGTGAVGLVLTPGEDIALLGSIGVKEQNAGYVDRDEVSGTG